MNSHDKLFDNQTKKKDALGARGSGTRLGWMRFFIGKSPLTAYDFRETHMIDYLAKQVKENQNQWDLKHLS